MRLCDQVAQCQTPLVIVDERGEHVMPGPSDSAETIKAVPLRYVLDVTATDHCIALLKLDAGMFVPENMALRMPSELFWLEWEERATDFNRSPRRNGVLVEASRDGRSGTVRSFWVDDAGNLDRAQALVRFDLDTPLAPNRGSLTIPARPNGLGLLAPHVVAELDHGWEEHFRRVGEQDLHRVLQLTAKPLFVDLIFALLFSAVLASQSFEARASNLERLNMARRRRGREPLLEHLELKLALGQALNSGTASPSPSGRTTPRLHMVRGHMVRRDGKQFWRCTHMRGALGAEVVRKTVRVSAPAHR